MKEQTITNKNLLYLDNIRAAIIFNIFLVDIFT